MRTHVTVLGVLQLVCGGIAILLSAAAAMGFGILGAFVRASGDPDARIGATFLGLLGAAAAVVLLVSGLLCVVCGVGLLNHKPWARILGIILCALSLIRIPLGTIFGIYGLWVLFNKETEALFAPPAERGV